MIIFTVLMCFRFSTASTEAEGIYGGDAPPEVSGPPQEQRTPVPSPESRKSEVQISGQSEIEKLLMREGKIYRALQNWHAFEAILSFVQSRVLLGYRIAMSVFDLQKMKKKVQSDIATADKEKSLSNEQLKQAINTLNNKFK
jgi:hypothetical protein